MKNFWYVILIFVMTACAKPEKHSITIDTVPQGATISVAEKSDETGELIKKEIGVSPVTYEIIPQGVRNVSAEVEVDGAMGSSPKKTIEDDPKYVIFAVKEGYFAEKQPIEDYSQLLKDGTLKVRLEQSPLWWGTTSSTAANQWSNLVVNPEISDTDMWQRVIDSVTKRFSELKEYDLASGYLTTGLKVKEFSTPRGKFLLRSQFVATITEREPLTYRVKIISQWSHGEGVKWELYPRVFTEDADLITELLVRSQTY